MRIAWVTDPHLNFVSDDRRQDWIDQIRQSTADIVVVTGDISEGHDVDIQLRRLAEQIELPIRFVLGNHDFYGAAIADVRRRVVSMCRGDDRLVYLTDSSALPLTDDVWLVGEDGWGDATMGDAVGTPVQLNDDRQIADLRGLAIADRNDLLQQLGRQSADRLHIKLAAVPDSAQQVFVATHVPPFREACWYEGQTTDDHWAPFFVCGQLGDVVLRYADSHRSTQLTVLCGHTHHAGVVEMSGNLTVHTAGAQYAHPTIAMTLEI